VWITVCKGDVVDININSKKLGRVMVVEIAGSIDGKTAPEALRQISPLLHASSKILLDMSQVKYMSSAGVRMLLTIYRQMASNDGRVALVGMYEQIQDTLSVTGFLSHFTTYQTVDEGLAAFQ
jgi:anti-sigma B factor antagonist